MKRALSFFISLFIGIGLLVWIISTVGWQEIQSSFLIFTGWQGLVILFLTFLMLWVGSLKWRLILRSQGYELSPRQAFAPYLACFAMGYLFQILVVSGEIFRGYILKDKYSIPWKKAASSIVIDKVLEGTSFLFTILAGLGFFLFKIGLPPRNLCIIFGVVLFCLIFATAVFYLKSFKKESIAKPIIKFFNKKGVLASDILEIEKESFEYFKPTKLVFWQGIGLAFLRVVVTWARSWVLLLFLGKSAGFLSALSILGFYYITTLIPIPADLGIHEVIQVFSFAALGIGANIAPAFAMIQRGAQLIAAAVGMIIFLKLGMGLLHALLFKKIDSIIKQNNEVRR